MPRRDSTRELPYTEGRRANNELRHTPCKSFATPNYIPIWLSTDPSIYISIYFYPSKAYLPYILLSIDLSICLSIIFLSVCICISILPLFPARCAFVSYRCSKCLLMADSTALFVCVLSHVYARVLSAWKLFVFLSILQYIHTHQSSSLPFILSSEVYYLILLPLLLSRMFVLLRLSNYNCSFL